MFDRRRYTGRLTIPLEAETIAALEAVATEAKASVASVARECIRRGLDPTRRSVAQAPGATAEGGR